MLFNNPLTSSTLLFSTTTTLVTPSRDRMTFSIRRTFFTKESKTTHSSIRTPSGLQFSKSMHSLLSRSTFSRTAFSNNSSLRVFHRSASRTIPFRDCNSLQEGLILHLALLRMCSFKVSTPYFLLPESKFEAFFSHVSASEATTRPPIVPV